MAALPPPSMLIGHDKFDRWYPGQEEAASQILDWLSDPNRRFLCASAPTGSGKSLLAVLASITGGHRTAILTVTKGLQAQLNRDFTQIGMTDIRGQNSYPCILLQDQSRDVTVEDGPCHSGISCNHKDGGCLYYDQLRTAKLSQLVVTNYAYYLAQTHHGQGGLGPRSLLVCDEAHLAFKAIESYMTIQLGRSELESMGLAVPIGQASLDDWREWAQGASSIVGIEAENVKSKIKEMQDNQDKIPTTMLRQAKHLDSLQRRLESLSNTRGRWIDHQSKSGWSFTPVWPGQYSELLFQKTPKVLVMSATMTPKTADSLSIPEQERKWLEVPSSFPPSKSPFIHVKATRMNHRTTPEDLRVWVNRIDQLIGRRMDRKGIVFTVSYDRRNYLMSQSSYVPVMQTHGRDDVYQVVDQFKKSPPPAVLVSPTVTTGWDFPGTECEYVIVGKIPYPDTRDPVVKERVKEDPEWGWYEAMMTLVQESGRGTRSAEDCCEAIIVDDNWRWFWPRYQHLAPEWFKQRVHRRSYETVPDPLV